MTESSAWIPVYLPDRAVVGKAKLEARGDTIYLLAELEGEYGRRVRDLIVEQTVGVSIVSLTQDAKEALAPEEDPHKPWPNAHPSVRDHEHNPVQHRDGKVPWCDMCRKDEFGQKPRFR